MARGRMISKTLGTASRKFARLRTDEHIEPLDGLFAQALFPLLVANADDWGRLHGDAFTVKHSCFSTAPESLEQFDAALDALDLVDLIVRYVSVGHPGEVFLQIVGFDLHQQGLHKSVRGSRFPAPSENPENRTDSQIHKNLPESREIPGAPEKPALTELNRTELNRKEPNQARASENSPEEKPPEEKPREGAEARQREGFERFWELYPRQQARKPAWAAWRDIDPNPEFTAQILAAVERFRATKTCQDAIASGDCTYVPLPENWLRDGRWLDSLTTNAPRPATPAPRRCSHTPTCADEATCTRRRSADMRAGFVGPKSVEAVPA